MNLLESILYLTLNVYHEARGEDQMSQVAVAHVVLNRQRLTGKSIREVVLEPYQFSWTHLKTNWIPEDPRAFFKCLHSVSVAVQGYDFTGGALYYHRTDINPYWSTSFEPVGQFGSHQFYREVRQ